MNARGGIEFDPTVARIAEDRFDIVPGTGFATHGCGKTFQFRFERCKALMANPDFSRHLAAIGS